MSKKKTDMLALVRDLFPICRSITGDGVRATLDRIGQDIPVTVTEIASGTKVFDWQVPAEWNVHDAYVRGPDGRKIIDFKENNLHLVSYSVPVDAEFSLAELKRHLFTIPDKPDWVPYRTSYYKRDWGFCLSHRQFESLQAGLYSVRVDSELDDNGSLSLGELFIPGRSREEILVWSHCCHPSLANDNLSGIAATVAWASRLLDGPQHRFGYRFVWGPGTIGSICWLARNRESLANIAGGLVVVLVGRKGALHYKRSRDGNGLLDRVVQHVLHGSGRKAIFRDFDPYGYDERQFGSPGINLPVGRLTRLPNGEYPEYHTSADNLDLLDESSLEEILDICLDISDELNTLEMFRSLHPHCEPQLGKRGLYRETGGTSVESEELAMLWILNQSDGFTSLEEIASRADLPIDGLRKVAGRLIEAGLLQKI